MRTSTRRFHVSHLALASLFLAGACSRATHLAATWHDPAASSQQFNRLVTVFVSNDESTRRSIEERLASKVPHGTPSYRALPSLEGIDAATVRAKLRDAGYDGALIMRVIDVSERTTYVSGQYWGPSYGFGAYWNSAWAYPYDPAYVVTDRVVTVETEIYALGDDRLAFAARSETLNKSSFNSLIDSIMRHIDEQLRHDGLVAVAPAGSHDVSREPAGVATSHAQGRTTQRKPMSLEESADIAGIRAAGR
jgi:hypothetical protein